MLADIIAVAAGILLCLYVYVQVLQELPTEKVRKHAVVLVKLVMMAVLIAVGIGLSV